MQQFEQLSHQGYQWLDSAATSDENQRYWEAIQAYQQSITLYKQALLIKLSPQEQKTLQPKITKIEGYISSSQERIKSIHKKHPETSEFVPQYIAQSVKDVAAGKPKAKRQTRSNSAGTPVKSKQTSNKQPSGRASVKAPSSLPDPSPSLAKRNTPPSPAPQTQIPQTYIRPQPVVRSIDQAIQAISDPQKKQRVVSNLQKLDPNIRKGIESEIVWDSPGVAWDSVIGLNKLKALLKEVVVFPIIRPDLFTALRAPPKGILLFGPPGTGKTHVARALASEANARFFSISASSLTSKWVGEGEKMVKALFTVANAVQPSIVFIDEIDSLLSARSSEENESSRRMKTEFLVQMDGVSSDSDDRVIVLGATNRPFDLDDAILRRMPRRVYLPLPTKSDRVTLVKHLLQSSRQGAPAAVSLTAEEYSEIGRLTEMFSNADLTQLCRDAALGPIRDLPKNTITTIHPSQIPPICFRHFQTSLKSVRPSINKASLKQYTEWNAQFGMKT